ncbi:uncharacterized protein BDZ99DRAFT_290893 [Mytilinidion resinicola]|uniref:Uncharacterized protein n=1 Tax=Mytilinidion resinicola TaxID=574789 RepID=A0A6A6YQ36_9PEZI|nr:uncharacterized protein BDZ99DRAFT_290893 [Mytilinidion resinicola]KAF2810900.1 hypothetical protein BDZ99DRAFT_290893 [Mytilinidion resinicola]
MYESALLPCGLVRILTASRRSSLLPLPRPSFLLSSSFCQFLYFTSVLVLVCRFRHFWDFYWCCDHSGLTNFGHIARFLLYAVLASFE